MIVVNSKEELEKLINQRIGQYGPKCDLNDIDVSRVTDMSHLFDLSIFDGDISKWDTSSVENMESMFCLSQFKGDISKWDVSSVESMYNIFKSSPLRSKKPSWYREY